MGLPQGWASIKNVDLFTCHNWRDEIRLLGNGVVPDTAAKAFITLLNKLT